MNLKGWNGREWVVKTPSQVNADWIHSGFYLPKPYYKKLVFDGIQSILTLWGDDE